MNVINITTSYGVNPAMSGMMMETKPSEETAQTIRSSPGGENGIVQMLDTPMCYIVRRLTPVECERLMGLPGGYTIPAGLDPADDELVEEFRRIFDTFGEIMAAYSGKKPPKPKTAKQVAKWLAAITDPETCPDAPRYKGCGNGMCTNQVRWIFTRLLSKECVEW